MAALSVLRDPIDEAVLERDGYPGGPVAKAGRIVLRPGLRLRLSRNLDKGRGFVNGALCTIMEVLSRSVAVVTLTTGRLVLLHPTNDGGKIFLPCAYGYATTIRKVQGASLDAVVLFFDHCYPPDRGYGYVGASRARSKDGALSLWSPTEDRLSPGRRAPAPRAGHAWGRVAIVRLGQRGRRRL